MSKDRVTVRVYDFRTEGGKIEEPQMKHADDGQRSCTAYIIAHQGRPATEQAP